MKLLASFVYNGGTNPGNVRSVLIDSVDGDYVTGEDVHNGEPRKYKKELISAGSVQVGELLAEVNMEKILPYCDITKIRIGMGGDTYAVPARRKFYILKQTDNKGLKLVKPVVTELNFVSYRLDVVIKVNNEKNGLTVLVDGRDCTHDKTMLSSIFRKISLN